jgi:predicted ATPase
MTAIRATPTHSQNDFRVAGTSVYATEFVGRQSQLTDLEAALRLHSLVSIVAPGGMGKTRLAIEALTQMRASFSDGAVFVELSSIRNADQVPGALAHALGLELKDDGAIASRVLAFLADKSMLLVLDNFEHLLGSAGFVDALCEQAPKIRVIVTTRERLALPVEHVIELRGLPVAQSHDEPGDITGAERLFLDAARQLRPSYHPAADEMTHIRRICQMAGGMPLAIELAAAWVTQLPVRFIAEQIALNIDWLTTSRGLAHTPQRSVRAVFDYFWSRLSDHEQQCLARLSVFRGGFECTAALQVADASQFFLSALVDRAFLTQTTEVRYQLHELLLQYAGEKLGKSPQAVQTTRDLHAQYILTLADSGAPTAQLDAELPNLRAALGWAIEQKTPDLALRLVTQYEHFWRRRGHMNEACAWARDAMALYESPAEPGPALRADWIRALQMLGGFNERMGNYDAARQDLYEAIRLGDVDGDTNVKSRALGMLALVFFREGKYEEAMDLGGQAIQLAREGTDRWALANALRVNGTINGTRGAHPEALSLLGEARMIATELGDLELNAVCVNAMAVSYTNTAEYAQAIAYFEHTRMLYQQLGSRDREAVALLNLGWTHAIRDEFSTAVDYDLQALAIFRAIGAQDTTALVLVNLANAEIDMQVAAERVAPRFYEALTIVNRIKALPISLYALVGTVRLVIQRGDDAQAARWIGLTLVHPATPNDCRESAGLLRDTLAGRMPAEALAAGLDQGGRLDLPTELAAAMAYLAALGPDRTSS